MNTCCVCHTQDETVTLQIDPWYNENEGVEIFDYFCPDCLVELQNEVTE